jgi:peptide/nickel transport system permease protein
VSKERIAGAFLAALLVAVAALGSRITGHDPADQFHDFVFAPPMVPRVFDIDGALRRPFVYPLVLEDRLARHYVEDRAHPAPIRFFAEGRVLSLGPSTPARWFPLGTDALGRDQLSRLAAGARLSLGVALLAALGALAIGATIGGIAGAARGRVDEALMRTADLIVALPAVYAVLALRSAMPLVLTTPQIFWTMTAVLALVGWPLAARGVRAVVAAERAREYAEAARALGASRTRLLLRHLLPAARGFLVVQGTLLLPAFVLAEATLSFVGLGFNEPVSSWGAMLRQAGSGRAVLDAPWLLTPAAAIVVAALSIHLLAMSDSAHLSHPVRGHGIK